METTSVKCEFCGTRISYNDDSCHRCGAQNTALSRFANIKALLIATFRLQQAENEKIQARINTILGVATKNKTPQVLVLLDQLLEQISTLMAIRLLAEDKSVPLLSEEDFGTFISQMLDQIGNTGIGMPDPEERKMLEGITNIIFKGVVEMATKSVPVFFRDPYEYYANWLTAISQIASERNIAPIAVLGSVESADDITRRLLTMEQYIDQFTSVMENTLNLDNMINSMIQPMIDMLITGEADLEPEEKAEFLKDLKTEVTPQLEEYIRVARQVFDAYFAEEVGRIYQ